MLRTGMSIEDLLDGRLALVWIDVPDLKLTVESANKEVLFIDLVEESRVLVVIDLVINALASGLNINTADKDLLIVEARNGQDRRR